MKVPTYLYCLLEVSIVVLASTKINVAQLNHWIPTYLRISSIFYASYKEISLVI